MMLYQPRDFDSFWDEVYANDEIGRWIEEHSAGVWFRVFDQPVRLVYFLTGERTGYARVKTQANDYWKVDIIDGIEVIDPNDEARNASLLCPNCGGEGEIHPLNNPTGQTCPDCFGCGKLLRELYR